MTKIGDIGQQTALLQLQLAARLNAAQNSPEAPKSKVGSRSTSSVDTRQGAQEVDSLASPEVLSAVRELRGSGDALRKSAFRVFLRQRLVKDLDLTVAKGALLERLLDDVIERMEFDSELQNSIMAAGEVLVKLSERPEEHLR